MKSKLFYLLKGYAWLTAGLLVIYIFSHVIKIPLLKDYPKELLPYIIHYFLFPFLFFLPTLVIKEISLKRGWNKKKVSILISSYVGLYSAFIIISLRF